MNELLQIVANVWPYWLIFAMCFLVSIEYVKGHYQNLIREKEEVISDLVFNDSEVTYKYNTLVDKYNQLRIWYEQAYNQSEHILITQTYLTKNTIKIFTQILYSDSQMIFITNTINLKTGEAKALFSKRGYNPKENMI